jgi:hypothetical protein
MAESKEEIFDIYCRFMLEHAGAMHGRYSKEDLREQVLRLPHAFAVGLHKDRLIEEYRIIPDDAPIEGWVNDKVVGMVERGAQWEPEAFWMSQQTTLGLKGWNAWMSLDAYFMPRGLEPALFIHNERYVFKGITYYICEFRFLPLRSFEFRRPMPSGAP